MIPLHLRSACRILGTPVQSQAQVRQACSKPCCCLQWRGRYRCLPTRQAWQHAAGATAAVSPALLCLPGLSALSPSHNQVHHADASGGIGFGYGYLGSANPQQGAIVSFPKPAKVCCLCLSKQQMTGAAVLVLACAASSPLWLGSELSTTAGVQIIPQGTCQFLNVWTEASTFQHYYNEGQFSQLGSDVRGQSIPFTSGQPLPLCPCAAYAKPAWCCVTPYLHANKQADATLPAGRILPYPTGAQEF